MCHRGCTGATHSVHVALEPLGCTRDRVVEEGTPKQTYIQTRHVSRIKKGMIPLSLGRAAFSKNWSYAAIRKLV